MPRVHPVFDGDWQPANRRLPALETLPQGLRRASTAPETDLHAAAGSGKPLRNTLMRAMSAPTILHPGTRRWSDLRVLRRGTFTLRGELVHAFISYRVATEGTVFPFYLFKLSLPFQLSSCLLHFRPLHIAHP
jgi:hypothetical protein